MYDMYRRCFTAGPSNEEELFGSVEIGNETKTYSRYVKSSQ